MFEINIVFFVMGILLFVSVLVSRISTRLGMPLLLTFLGMGMLAGEEGFGIKFDNFTVATIISQMSLAMILLDGGLRTKLKVFRIALKPAVALASWGVLASVAILGVFATFYLHIDWQLGVLMAAIVGSTDAAAVFSLLRNSGVRLNERIQATLELESGINDPMAILLVSLFIGMIVKPEAASLGGTLLMLVQQLGLGLGFGLLAGKILAMLLSKIRLAEGLYALMIASGGLLVFSLTNLFDGSGFLAVYLVGVMVGNSHNSSTQHVLNVMDGLAWLAQAAMFLVLGLLVTPSRVWSHGLDALIIAGCLIFVARPLAVWSSLKWFNKYANKEIAYISWVGLRGAVPITLAIIPMMEGVQREHAQLLFDVAFAVVILSLLIQGTTIGWIAQVRDNQTINVNMATQMQAGDIAWYVLPEDLGDEFALQFASADKQLREQQFYGEFVVNPDVKLRELAFMYGLKIQDDVADSTLLAAFRHAFGDVPVAGDCLDWDGVRVTVKELDEKSYVKSFGLKLPKK